MSQQLVTANLYTLAGHHAHVTYAASALDGKPHLTYQDTHQTRSFKGDELRMVESDLGTLISVTLQLTVDAGSTSFTLLLPRVRIATTEHAHVETDGITAIHRFSIVPALLRGQLDTYTVTRFTGTASFVVS
ncbi:MAG: hypothetical protein K8W52_25050 [Deltaproteobacteria bacterium]|nr:hypothetical protein [Deltaproteobacteria bacterium]